MFGYIPDPTNLGTTFVNAISNILTTAAIDVKINISQEIIQNTFMIEAGEFEILKNKVIQIGSIRHG
jgi:hypothetical protein